LNVTSSSLESFAHIAPCGIPGVEMTCLERESGRLIEVEHTATIMAEVFVQELPSLSSPEREHASAHQG
jgi:lipoate-protein ligase B